MVKGGETQGKEEGGVAASSFAVAVGPWVAGERAGTEEEGGDQVRGRRNSREGEKWKGRKEIMFIYILLGKITINYPKVYS